MQCGLQGLNNSPQAQWIGMRNKHTSRRQNAYQVEIIIPAI